MSKVISVSNLFNHAARNNETDTNRNCLRPFWGRDGHSITVLLGFFVAFVVGLQFLDFLFRVPFEDAVVRRIVLMLHTILVSLIFITAQ